MTPHNCKKYINSSPDMDCDCSSCLEGKTAVNEVKSVRYGGFNGSSEYVFYKIIESYEDLIDDLERIKDKRTCHHDQDGACTVEHNDICTNSYNLGISEAKNMINLKIEVWKKILKDNK